MKRIVHGLTMAVVGLAISLAQSGMASAQSLPYNTQLQRELTLTSKYCSGLQPKIDYVQTKVSRANSVLNITRRVSNATNKIEQRLKANIDVMLPLTFIPKVGKLVKVIRKGVQIVHRKIKPVNRTLKKADKTIAPYRKPLPSVQRALGYSKKGLRATCKFAALYLKANRTVTNCVRRLQPGSLKNSLARKLEVQAKAFLPPLKKLNKTLKAVDDATNKTNKALHYPASLYPGVLKFERGFRPIELAINYTHYPIKYLNIVLKKKITIVVPKKFKVRIKVKFDPRKPDLPKFRVGFRTRKLNVTFTVRQILNGIEGPFKYLEGQFMKLAMKKLGPLSVKLRKLKSMYNKLQIPGVSGYLAKLKRLRADLKMLPLLSKVLLANLPQFNVGLSLSIRTMWATVYSVRCVVCRGSSYLTKAGKCQQCKGNTYAQYGATSCRPCPKGTFQVDHFRCVKKVANCLTHPKFVQEIMKMKRMFHATLQSQCRTSSFGTFNRSSCTARVLWRYSPILKRNLSCNIKGGYPAFLNMFQKKKL